MTDPASVLAGGHRFLVWTWCGPARPLLWLHGFAGRGDAFRPVAERLGRGRTVLAVNLPGHDPLTPARPGCGFEEAVDELGAALAALSLREIHLAGYSLGARLALGLLVNQGRLFSRATLVGVNPGLRSAAERAERRRSDAGWAETLRVQGLAAFLRRWEAQPLFASQADLPPAARDAQRAQRLDHDPLQLALALENLSLAAMPDLWPRLSEIALPTQVVAGELDPKFRAIAEAMRPHLQRGTVHVVAGAGHNIALERPGDLAALLDSP